MKVIFSALSGAVVLSEDAGVVSLSFDDSIGGGAAAGLVSGKGSVQLNGPEAIQLAEKLLNSKLPASVLPLAQVVEGVAAQAIAAIE